MIPDEYKKYLLFSLFFVDVAWWSIVYWSQPILAANVNLSDGKVHLRCFVSNLGWEWLRSVQWSAYNRAHSQITGRHKPSVGRAVSFTLIWAEGNWIRNKANTNAGVRVDEVIFHCVCLVIHAHYNQSTANAFISFYQYTIVRWWISSNFVYRSRNFLFHLVRDKYCFLNVIKVDSQIVFFCMQSNSYGSISIWVVSGDKLLSISRSSDQISSCRR